MKPKLSVVGGAAVTGLFVVTLLPVLLLATGSPDGTCGVVADASTDAIAATIRQLESGNDYTVSSSGSSASGAYEFLDSAWGGYGGYPRAYLAPPEVQDAKAGQNIQAILAANNNDPSAVSVSWYIGHVPQPGAADWDLVPSPGAGNRLTPRQYQTKWMEIYRTKLDPSASTTGGGSAGAGSSSTTSLDGACVTGVLATSGNYALPLERIWYDQHPDWFTKPHHDYPAADIPVPIDTPVFAAAGGVVVSTTTSGKCGIGVVINGDDGAQYTYCHGLPGSHAVTSGDKVLAGRRLMSSASTGNSTGPHLHFGIRTDGQNRCPQPFLVAIAEGRPIEPTGLPTSGCYY